MSLARPAVSGQQHTSIIDRYCCCVQWHYWTTRDIYENATQIHRVSYYRQVPIIHVHTNCKPVSFVGEDPDGASSVYFIPIWMAASAVGYKAITRTVHSLKISGHR